LKNLLKLNLIEFKGLKLRTLAEGLIPLIQLDQEAVSRKQYVKLLIELVESQRLVDDSEQQLTESSVKLTLIQAIWPVVSQSATKHDFDLLTKSVVYLHNATRIFNRRLHHHIDPSTGKIRQQLLRFEEEIDFEEFVAENNPARQELEDENGPFK
jgi:hypothetical protein